MSRRKKSGVGSKKWADISVEIPLRYDPTSNTDANGNAFFDPNAGVLQAPPPPPLLGDLLPAMTFNRAGEARSTPKNKNGGAAIFRFGGVGDNLMASSPLPLLKQKFGRVDVFSEDPCAVIFENNPHIDRIIRPDKKPLMSGEPNAWQQWFYTRGLEYEFAVNLSHSCETVGALFHTQTQFWWPQSMRRKFCGRSYIEIVHDICEVPYEFGPLFFPTEAEKAKALETKASIGERVIGWCIAGTRIDKVWPYMPIAIARIIREFGIPIVMIGSGGKDFALAKNVMKHVELQNSVKFDKETHGRMLHLALSPEAPPGEPKLEETWPLRRSLAFAQACDLIISPDSGVAWSCAFEPMPKVMMLSHASPENITKHWLNTVNLHADPAKVDCWPCHRLHEAIDTCRLAPDDVPGVACISDISIEMMIDAVKTALSLTST